MQLSNLSHGRENNITLLRFLGAVFVLLGHSWALRYGAGTLQDPLSALIRAYTAFGVSIHGMGVSLFFVLSGFLVTISYALRDNIFEYFESRILRIFPALSIAVLLTVFLVGTWATSLPLVDYLSHTSTWMYIIDNSSLLKIHYTLPGVFLENPRHEVNGSLWTLPIELWMYMCVAFIGLLGILKSGKIFNLFFLFLILLYLSDPKSFPLLAEEKHVQISIYFLFGAFYYMNADRIPINFTALSILALFCSLGYKSPYFDFLFVAFFSYLVLLVAYHPSLKLPNIDRFGDFSYGIYIYAYPVEQSIIFIYPSLSAIYIALYSFLVVMVLAILSWNYIERPTLRLKGYLHAYSKRIRNSI